MNKFMTSGRVARDPEIRVAANGNSIVNFSFAVQRAYKQEGQQEADFFDCVAFGKTADIFEKCNISKGTKLIIEGEMRNNNYTDKEGAKHYSMQYVINRVEFAESKGASEAPASKASNDDFMKIDSIEESLPFN